MTRFTSTLLAATLSLVALTGCSTAPDTHEGKAELSRTSRNAVEQAQVNDPTLVPVLRRAAAYAVFPSVAKGGAGLGGAYGKGDCLASSPSFYRYTQWHGSHPKQ